MSAPTDEGWSDTTHYHGRQPVEPRLFTEADPIGSVLISDWNEDEPRWSATTYVGRRRPSRKAAQAADAAPGTAVIDAPAPELTAPPTEAAPAGAAPDAAVVPDPATGSAPAVEATPALEPTPPAGPAEPVEATTRGLLASSGSIAVASLVSRITGFIRTILLLAALGIAGVGNAYNSGNNLPNMIYELLLGGVLSSVLIPLLVHAQEEDEDGGVAYMQRLLSIATAALAAMTLAAVAAAPLIAAAFVPAGSQRELTGIFATLLLPEIFFYGLGAMFTSVLNIRHVYKPGAWSPVLNNVIMIVTIGVFWLLPGPDTLEPASITNAQILVIGIGTTLGIAGQALVLIPALRRTGFTWQWRFRARPGEAGRLKEVGTLAGWLLGYVVVSQIGVTFIQVIGNHNGGFTVFTNADLLFQMPYGILVVSLLTAIMPRLSRAAVRGDNAAVVADLALGARLSAVALVPITAGLIALGPSMAVTLFASGHTSIADARLIGDALAWSAFGLFPFAIVMLQLRVFYAMRDGKTPTLINTFMVGAKVILILVTNDAYRVRPGVDATLHPSALAVEWLNIATSVSYVIGAIVGHIVLTRRFGRLGFRAVLRTVLQIGLASALGGLAAYGVVRWSTGAFGRSHLGSGVGLVLGALAGLLVLGVVAWRMRLPDVRQVAQSVRRSRESGRP